MQLHKKILLSVPSVISLFYYVTFLFPVSFSGLFPDNKTFQIINFSILGLNLVQLFFLLRYLWSFKKIDKKEKNIWTRLLVIFLAISALILIWKSVDSLKTKNETI